MSESSHMHMSVHFGDDTRVRAYIHYGRENTITLNIDGESKFLSLYQVTPVQAQALIDALTTLIAELSVEA